MFYDRGLFPFIIYHRRPQTLDHLGQQSPREKGLRYLVIYLTNLHVHEWCHNLHISIYIKILEEISQIHQAKEDTNTVPEIEPVDVDMGDLPLASHNTSIGFQTEPNTASKYTQVQQKTMDKGKLYWKQIIHVCMLIIHCIALNWFLPNSLLIM